MNLTPEQLHALATGLNPPAPVTSLTGPAGSGKSTLLAELVKQDPNSVVLAPTNKAATVLRTKGIVRATTVHSALYSPAERQTLRKDAAGDTVFQRDATTGEIAKDINDQPIPEILSHDVNFTLREDNLDSLPPKAYVDESSMLQESVLEDLQSIFKHVVLIGDKFQLPPVKSKDVFALFPPAAELRTVHRQALENPILVYANSLRTEKQFVAPALDGHRLNRCSFNNKKLFESLVANSVQAICFSNKLRHILNDKIRAAKGLPKNTLLKGETIVALENVRVTLPGQDRPQLKFYNGEILTLAEDAPVAANFYSPTLLKFEGGKTQRCWPFWLPNFFDEYESPRFKNKVLLMRGQSQLWGNIMPADYSYCMTAHKAQGSEWPNVAVFDQRSTLLHALGESMALRWLYTALTRAQERCLMVEC